VSSPTFRITAPEEYLEAERKAEAKHELINGQIYAMAEASRHHVAIVKNLLVGLDARLRGRGCEVGASDLRVRIASLESYAYPDVVVYCGGGRWRDDCQDTLEDPTLAIEVLSPSTQRFDRGDKFKHYRRLPSLMSYLLVAQDQVEVEHYVRQEDGRWLLTEYGRLGDVCVFPALGIDLPLAEIYREITF